MRISGGWQLPRFCFLVSNKIEVLRFPLQSIEHGGHIQWKLS
jgi:hypothetical protein